MNTQSILIIKVYEIHRQPLYRAEVIINGKNIAKETGPGEFTVSNLSPGMLEVTVQSANLQSQTQKINIGPGKNEAIFILGKAGLPFYYRQGTRVPFEPIQGRYGLAIRGRKQKEEAIKYLERIGIKSVKQSNKNLVVFETAPENFAKLTNEIRSIKGVAALGPLVHESGEQVSFLSGNINVKATREASDDEIIKLAEINGLEVIRKLVLKGHWLFRSPSTDLGILADAEKLMSSPIVITAEAELTYTIESDAISPTDELVDEQWHIPHIDLPVAWQYLRDANAPGVTPGSANDRTFGSANIAIAVIDEGMQSQTMGGNTTATHPDFQGNVSNGMTKVVSFFDFGDMEADNNEPLGSHGIQCSGVATANANNASGVGSEEEGVSGAAPNCRLISVQCPGAGTETEFSDIYLWMSGIDPLSTTAGFPALPAQAADVITNSAGGYNPAVWPITTLMNDTFNTITDDGRGGLGTLMFFSAGNGSSPDFHLLRPWANHDRTFGIGACNENDIKSEYSNWGEGVDLCAPSDDVASRNLRGIVTTITPGTGVLAGHTGGAQDYTDSFGGTSSATPLTAGVAALMLSMNPTLTWQQVRDIFYNTAEKIDFGNTDADGQWRDRDGDGINEYSDWYGFGRIDAAKAVRVAEEFIQFDTPVVMFLDVPEEEPTIRAIAFTVRSIRNLTFKVIHGPNTLIGPANSFPLHAGDQAIHIGNYTGAESHPRIWIRFTGTTDGDVLTAEAKVQCLETGVIYDVSITANVIQRPRAAIVLSLDKSGSMNDNAGDGRKKIDVLHDSAVIVAALAQEDTGLGAVSWDSDADLAGAMAVIDAGPEFIGLGRADLQTHIGNHQTNIMGMTAIGDAVVAAQTLLTGASDDYEVKAMVVLTDGNETESLYLSELAPGTIGSNVFAIGLGTAENIQPAALNTLTASNNGYILMTGIIDNDDRFMLTKYFQQILAGVSNMQIVVDPDGWINPGTTLKIPFRINETDWRADAVLHCAFPEALTYLLEAPDGSIIDPASLTGDPVSKYVTDKNVAYYRLSFPLTKIGAQDPGGTWYALISIDSKRWKSVLEKLGNDKKEARRVAAHGLRYSFVVQARSVLGMAVQLSQNSLEPGAKINFRTTLTEYGYPAPAGASVNVHVEAPDGSSVILSSSETSQGIFDISWIANLSGVYKAHVYGKGFTSRGSSWTREALRTAMVWRGGNNPSPKPGVEDKLCRMITCFERNGLLDNNKLKEIGIDLKGFKKCVCGKRVIKDEK